MTRQFSSLLLTLLFLFPSFAGNEISAQMLVGSYNIRYQNKEDNERGNSWKQRCPVICDQVNFLAPDIFGAQEVLHPQLLDLLQGLDGYDYIGVGRDDGKTEGEYAAIFYKKDHIRLLDNGNFWLSETPEKPGLGWDAACIRICTWGKFKNMKSKKKFFFFNLHMDHVGTTARREAAKLVVQRIREIAKGAPVILTGDFNVDQTNEIYRIFTESGILKDSYLTTRLRFAKTGTFNSFKPDLYTTSRIDHVFVSPQTRVDAYGLLTDAYWTPDSTSVDKEKASDAPQEISFSRYQRRLPSDHSPVFVRIK
ncbi:MAG: endonuclease/exonuclease/phosphatase family protein [Prevotella sp.]|nr:endonuclease/exonuclease/phosphatase family protein [Prevotella sp.]